MSHQMEQAISDKCSKDLELADFTEQERAYITKNQSFLDWLFYWFECSSSDGCWTEENYHFMTSFYATTTPVYRLCNPLNQV